MRESNIEGDQEYVMSNFDSGSEPVELMSDTYRSIPGENSNRMRMKPAPETSPQFLKKKQVEHNIQSKFSR